MVLAAMSGYLRDIAVNYVEGGDVCDTQSNNVVGISDVQQRKQKLRVVNQLVYTVVGGLTSPRVAGGTSWRGRWQ